MPRKPRREKATPMNEFICAVERTQNQKLCIRIRAHFARNDWVLPVFFLASSFGRATKNLDQALRFLQQSEEKLWFWGVDRSDDPNLADELLSDFGLRLDRRKDFPRRAAVVTLALGKPPTAFQLTQLRRELEAMKGTVRLAATGD